MSGLGAGLDTQLGPTLPGGVDLSFGQWQRIALARGFMRDRRSSSCWTSRRPPSTRRRNTRGSNGTLIARIPRTVA